VSAVSAFEISYKVKIGKLDAARELVDRFHEICDRLRLERLDLSVAHALRAGKLEGAHFDPFDRMIAAQAIIEGLPVLTVDRQFKALGAEVVWG
jgi:PIN domain nuclease of toxin-antitoxin system